MRRRVDVRDDGHVEISLLLSRLEARLLACMIRAALDKGLLRCAPADPWRKLANAITTKVPWPNLLYGYVERPSDECGSSELDMDHVLNGSAPYPLLCPADMKRVWPQLEAKNMTLDEVAQRLRVSARTVSRWRKRAREEGKN